MTRLLSLITVLTLSVLGACDGSSASCLIDADCASGSCRADGTCAPPPTGEEGDAGDAFDGGERDGGEVHPSDGGSDAGTQMNTGCLPNSDGFIVRSEVPMVAGARANFRIAQNESWASAGELQADGGRVWNLSGDFASDRAVEVKTQALEGEWFAADFPEATYVTKLSASSELLGVFKATADALVLQGVVSPEDGIYRTRLRYDPAVTVLKFPLSLDATWSTNSTVSGIASGAVVSYSEKHEASVDAAGDLLTPYAPFPILRVATRLVRTIGWSVTSLRSHVFVAECFGTVAVVTSQSNESDPSFSDAAEVRRLSP